MLINMRNAMLCGKRLPYDAEVEFLESTGTQYIDTGRVADAMFGFEITCAFLDDNCVYGTINGTGGVGTARFDWVRYQFGRRYNVSGSNTLFYGFNNMDSNSWLSTPLDCANVHTYRVSNGEFFVDGRMQNYGQSSNFSANPFFLFASNSATGYSLAAKSRLYSAKIYDNDVLVRDFQPVRFTNELGQIEGAIFDRANPTVGMNPDGSARADGLYRNRGSGAFLYGNDI